eukprot:TRINITY_DN1850_c0_g1_i2.p1 TRINITY_DN1850_c0_g1~~TRINITY_DN1850_c0_g1_i2.p1  ORF type:complete len:456 (+),score=52.09 TRINITY_DN1850_c0_g1_i2:172-1539(+)
MMLDKLLKETAETLSSDDPRVWYFSMMADYHESVTAAKRSDTWESFAPDGNLYLYNAFKAERRLHCQDIRRQMGELADEFAHLLGGASVARDERIDALFDALGKVSFQDHWSTGSAEVPIKGFRPILEFEDRTHGFLWLVLRAEDNEWWHDLHAVVVSYFVLGVQMVAPALVIYNRSVMPTNYAADPKKLWNSMTWAETTCLGLDLSEKLTTVLGTLLLVVLITGIRLYANQEFENARKTGVLPFNRFWVCVGILANGWCVTLMALAFPLLFWSETTATAILLDVMALVFVWRLDDLNDFLKHVVHLTDEGFVRVVAWNAALLSQCPVTLRDIVNPAAKTTAEFWHVELDEKGRLLTFGSTQDAAGTRARRPCAVRLQAQDPILKEGDALLAKGRKTERVYSSSAKNVKYLPDWHSSFIVAWWLAIDWTLLILNWIVPYVWFVMKNPCYLERPRP